MITDSEFLHARADGLDHARAVRQRNAAILGRHLSQGHGQIMKVQRTGMQPDPDLPLARLTRVEDLSAFDMLKAEGVAQTDGFHVA